MSHAPPRSEEGREPEESPESEGLTEVEQEHSHYVEHGKRFDPSVRGGKPRAEGGERETTEPRLFTVLRQADESGVSGTGRVLDGCVFHNGQVVICWRGDINSEKSGYASLAIYPCWEAFHRVHIGAHPDNKTEIVFGQNADLISRLIDRTAEREAPPPDESEAGEE